MSFLLIYKHCQRMQNVHFRMMLSFNVTSTSVATGLFLACLQTFPSPQKKIGKKDGEGTIPVFTNARDTRNCVFKHPSSLASLQMYFGVRSSRIHFSPEMNAWRTNPKGRLRGGYRLLSSLASTVSNFRLTEKCCILRVTGNIRGTLSRFRERLNHWRDSYQEENNFARIFWIKILSDFYC